MFKTYSTFQSAYGPLSLQKREQMSTWGRKEIITHNNELIKILIKILINRNPGQLITYFISWLIWSAKEHKLLPFIKKQGILLPKTRVIASKNWGWKSLTANLSCLPREQKLLSIRSSKSLGFHSINYKTKMNLTAIPLTRSQHLYQNPP